MDTKTEVAPLEREYTSLRQQLRHQIREVSLLRRGLKESERSCKEQSLELRDLKKQCARLQEASMQNVLAQDTPHGGTSLIDRQKEQLQQQDNFLHRLEQQNDTINHLRHELFNRKTHMDSLTMQTRQAMELKSNFEEANRKLQQLNREISENLTECKDDLLRMQPPGQISDAEVSEHYSVLHQQIARWVDDETEDSHPLEQRFEALPVDSGEIPELLRKYLKNDVLQLGKKYQNSQPLVLRHLIVLFLDTQILRRDVDLFGLDATTAAVIRGVEHSMKFLEPKRGMLRTIVSTAAPHALPQINCHSIRIQTNFTNRHYNNSKLAIRNPESYLPNR